MTVFDADRPTGGTLTPEDSRLRELEGVALLVSVLASLVSVVGPLVSALELVVPLDEGLSRSALSLEVLCLADSLDPLPGDFLAASALGMHSSFSIRGDVDERASVLVRLEVPSRLEVVPPILEVVPIGEGDTERREGIERREREGDRTEEREE